MTKNIIIIILILGFIAAVVFLDIPTVQKVLDLRKSVKDEQKLLNEKKDFIDRIEKLIGTYQDNKETLKNIDSIMPDDSGIPDLIVQLEAVAAGSGVLLSDLNFTIIKEKTEEGQAPKDYNTVSVNMKMTGDYLSFNKFLKSVEENMRLLDIESINFAPKLIGTVSGFEFEVVLKTYYQK
jgi:Tfp pilus assembly protein PilO